MIDTLSAQSADYVPGHRSYLPCRQPVYAPSHHSPASQAFVYSPFHINCGILPMPASDNSHCVSYVGSPAPASRSAAALFLSGAPAPVPHDRHIHRAEPSHHQSQTGRFAHAHLRRYFLLSAVADPLSDMRPRRDLRHTHFLKNTESPDNHPDPAADRPLAYTTGHIPPYPLAAPHFPRAHAPTYTTAVPACGNRNTVD